MIPIYEQDPGKGIGYSSESFSQRFDELCQEHLTHGRARAFAFIFYDFLERDFRRVLKDEGVFAQLDRLSGSDLSVFYLHSGSRNAVERFNTEFLLRLNLTERVMLPCVVFFKLKNKQVTDVAAVHLESADLIHGFHELYIVIASYISESSETPPLESKHLRWIKSGTKFIGTEAFRALLEGAVARMM